ncbi:hypothetical protein AKJ16_DCAP02356 [Drosera capensis]
MIDPGTKLPPNRIHIFDPVGLIAHDHNYGASRSSTRSNETVPVSVTHSNGVEGIRFPVEEKDEGESNGSSPRLWNNSVATSPIMSTSPVHHHHYHQPMSPSSRTQAIDKGRRELMEMVRDMPESFYELSLKDIVEHRAAIHNASSGHHEKRTAVEDVEEMKASKSKKAMAKSESKAKMVRNGSVINGGMLARTTVFPILLGAKNGKSKSLHSAATFKLPHKAVSSSSGIVNGSSVNGTEKEWWKRRSCISSESESGGVGSSSGSIRSTGSSSRSSSSSSRRRQKNRLLPSCCYFSNNKRSTSKHS